METLTMKLPEGFASMIDRRHNGNKTRTQEEIDAVHADMQKLYTRYKKVAAMQHHLLEVEWDEYRIEENYGRKIFYNAHRRLHRYRKEIKKLSEWMFAKLTYMDGISAGRWDSFYCISVEEIIADFSRKYKQIM